MIVGSLYKLLWGVFLLFGNIFAVKGVQEMLVTKKVNNNVAICIDGNGRELIAIGKGIGFPKLPYEITDMNLVDRTFYDVDSRYLPLLNDIPMEIIDFTARMMDDVKGKLPYETSPNIVMTLADHIAFSIERHRNGIYVQMPSIYEMMQNYPLEVKIGKRFLSEIHRSFQVKLPQDEIQGIAMHFINAKNNATNPEQEELDKARMQQYEEMLEQTTQIIEWELDIQVRRDTFNYARFASHLSYLFRRMFTQQYMDSDNLQVYMAIREEYPKVAACVSKLNEYYQQNFSTALTEEEQLYLILHINRVCAKANT